MMLLGFIFAAVLARQDFDLVSLDYCSDQYVMALTEGSGRIALSDDAGSRFSYLAAKSSEYGRLSARSEKLILHRPAKIIRQWGGGININLLLKHFDVPIIQISYGNDLSAARQNLRQVGADLHHQKRAAELIADFDQRLNRLQKNPPPSEVKALYLTAGGMTTGTETFVDGIMAAAGVVNVIGAQGYKGWRGLGLEDLVDLEPDLIIGAFFDLETAEKNHFSLARHSYFIDLTNRVPTLFIGSALLACNGWFSLEVAERISEQAHLLSRDTSSSPLSGVEPENDISGKLGDQSARP